MKKGENAFLLNIVKNKRPITCNLNSCKLVNPRDVIFDEMQAWKWDDEQIQVPKIIDDTEFIPRRTLAPGPTPPGPTTSIGTFSGSSSYSDFLSRRVRSRNL